MSTEVAGRCTAKFNDRVIAYHESGHIVYAFRYGARIDWVHINNNGVDAGCCRYLYEGNSMLCKNPELIRRAMNISLAGLAAQQRYMLEKKMPYVFENCAADCRLAMQLLKTQQRPPVTTDPFGFWEIYGKEARDFVRVPANWTMIEALAKALLVKRYLTGAEAIDVMEEAAFKSALSLIDAHTTERDFEQTLKRQGFSRKRAMTILSKIKTIFKKEK